MKRFTQLKLWLLAMVILLGSGVTWGATVTYTISAKNTLTTSGTAPVGSSATIVETYSTSKQMTSGNSQTLTLSGYNGYKITSITLSMRSNSSSGAGNLIYKIDGGSDQTIISTNGFNNAAWYGAWSSSYVPVTKAVDITCGNTSTILKLSATVNSLYCESYSLTYEAIASSCTSLGTPSVTATPGNSEATLSWDAVENASSYTLVWNGGSPETVTSPVTKTGLTNGSSYSYSIMAVGDGTTYCETNTAATGNVTPVAPAFTITPSSNNNSYGTVSLSGNIITASPAAGYTYSTPAYTILSGTATVAQNGNLFTVTPTSECAIRINFEAKPLFTLSLSNDGDAYSDTNFPLTTYEGNTITLPTLDNCGAYTFVGWDSNSSTSSAPAYAGGATYTTTDGNVTLYAVYGQTTSTPETWTKINALEDIVSGTYVITNGDFFLPNTHTGAATSPAQVTLTSKGVNVADNLLVGTISSDMQWTFTGTNTAMAITSTASPADILYNINNNNGVRIHTSTTTWAFETYSSGSISGFAMKDATNSRYCAVYTAGSDWRSYTTRNAANYTTNSGILEIYKKSGGSTTTYTTSPNCTAPQIVVSQTTLTGFTYSEGTGPSSEQSFTISGINLEGDISISGTASFEVSKISGSGYTSPLIFTPSGSTVSEQTIYVRLKAGLTEADYNNEEINITSTGAESQKVTVSGSVTTAATPEPSAHVTDFAAVEDGFNKVILSWTDASGADGYLIKGSALSYEDITAPADGTAEADGLLVKNIASGVEIVELTGLAGGTTFYFKIWPYSNSGSAIDYKTDGSVPQADATTEAQPWLENFEAGSKGSYTSGEVISTQGSWTLDNALLGTLANDKKNNTQSVRIQSTGSIWMNFDKPGGAGSLTLYHANYGSDTGGKLILQLSVDGGSNWVNVGDEISSTGTLSASTFVINQSGNVRFRVNKTGGNRVNIDDILITDYSTVPASSTWWGNSSSEWRLASNWSHGTPGASTSVTIAASPHQPEIHSDVSVGSLTLEPLASLTVHSGKTLHLSGNLTLQSSAVGTATLVDHGTLTVSGTTTVEQYLTAKSDPSASDHWWYISSPVSGATSGSILVEGSSNKLGSYDESAAAYPQITATDVPLGAGRGYLAQINTTGTYTFSGPLTTGDVTVGLTRTPAAAGKRGFNLVGNPYPSHIRWNAITGFGSGSPRTDIRPTVWIRTRTASGAMDFDTFDGEDAVTKGKSGAFNGYIAPLQAFWVKVHTDNTTPSITFSNSMRSAQDQGAADNRLRAGGQSTRRLLRLELSNGVNFDQTLISTNANAQNSYDFYDSDKLSAATSSIPELYSLVEGRELVIDKRRSIDAGASALLGFRPGAAGTFTLKAIEKVNLDHVQVILRDHHHNTETELRLNESYSFSSDATATSSRFSIEFRAAGITSVEEVTSSNTRVYVAAARRIAVESAALTRSDRISVYSLAGEHLLSQEAEGAVTVLSPSFAAGVYLVKVKDHVQKIIVNY